MSQFAETLLTILTAATVYLAGCFLAARVLGLNRRKWTDVQRDTED